MQATYFEAACASVPKPQPKYAGQGGHFWRTEEPEMRVRLLDGSGLKVIKASQFDPALHADPKVTKGGMLLHQKAWWDLPNYIKLLVGGYGAGKSITLCKRAAAVALHNAPASTAIVSPTFPLARHTIIATMKQLLSGKQSLVGPGAFWWRYNKQEHVFTIRYKGREATVIVYSGEDPDSLRGPNLGAAYIDEPFIQDQAVFDQMVARVRHPGARQKEIGLGGTPEQLNWGYELCLGELKQKHDVAYVQASSRLNTILGGTYVQRLAGSFSDRAGEAYIEGAFVNLAKGMVYYGFRALNDINVRSMPIPPGAELGCGMDFNVNPMAFSVFWRHQNHMHFFEEYELENADTEYACSVLREHFVDRGSKRKVPEQWTLKEIFPDASGAARKTAAPQGKSDYWYIRQAGFDIRANDANPKVRDRENAVNGKFSPKSGPVTLTVDPKCLRLIRYCSTYSHELANKQEKMNHLLSAMGYPVAFLYPVSHEALDVHRLTGY